MNANADDDGDEQDASYHGRCARATFMGAYEYGRNNEYARKCTVLGTNSNTITHVRTHIRMSIRVSMSIIYKYVNIQECVSKRQEQV